MLLILDHMHYAHVHLLNQLCGIFFIMIAMTTIQGGPEKVSHYNDSPLIRIV